MGKNIITLLAAALLLSSALSTIIITETTPKMFQIAEGETMLVFDEDIDEEALLNSYQKVQQNQQSNQNKLPVEEQPVKEDLSTK